MPNKPLGHAMRTASLLRQMLARLARDRFIIICVCHLPCSQPGVAERRNESEALLYKLRTAASLIASASTSLSGALATDNRPIGSPPGNLGRIGSPPGSLGRV